MWKVPQIWTGDVWIIGGGPSITEQFQIPDEVAEGVRDKSLPLSAFSPYMSYLHDKHVIGVNKAFLIGDWVDVLFFGDRSFFRHNRCEIGRFPGLKVTCAKEIRLFKEEHIKYLAQDRNRPRGISENQRSVSWNLNSGAAAISLAANMGASRILLLGFDMNIDDKGNQHWHNEYKTAKRKDKRTAFKTLERHKTGFGAIAKDAKRRKIEIINVNPNSRIEELPKKSLMEIINEEKDNKY